MSMVPSGRAWEICCSLPRAEAGKTSIWYLLLVRLAISAAAQSASAWNASDVSYTWANFSLVWAAAGMATARARAGSPGSEYTCPHGLLLTGRMRRSATGKKRMMDGCRIFRVPGGAPPNACDTVRNMARTVAHCQV